MKKLLIVILLFTVIDIICTLVGVQMGTIEEGNPLLQWGVNHYPIVVGIVEILGASLLLYLLYRLWDRVKWLPYAIVFVCGAKFTVLYLHVSWIILYMKGLTV